MNLDYYKSNYHEDWQKNRIKFLIDELGESYFYKKTVLELGPHNGFIGNFFQKEFKCKLLGVEGRCENILKINETYPDYPVVLADLDVPNWKYGKFDIILNFGLLYHLQYNHTNNLENCIRNSKLLLLESVIYDSFDCELFLNGEEGLDQSLTNCGGVPSTSYVENILIKNKCNFKKINSEKLNGGFHNYTWIDVGAKIPSRYNRRFWIIN